jgi:hypothetical protein
MIARPSDRRIWLENGPRHRCETDIVDEEERFTPRTTRTVKFLSVALVATYLYAHGKIAPTQPATSNHMIQACWHRHMDRLAFD